MTWLRIILLALLPLVAAACGDLPQPFAHGRAAAPYPLAALTLDVRVAPVEGLPADAAQGLAQAMAENLGGFGVTATHRGEMSSRFVLHGRAATTTPPGANRADLLITWTLSDAEGTETGLHVQELRAAWTDWDPVDMGLMRAFAAAPAKAVAALVGVDADLPAGSATAPAGETLFVTAVEGAPGDGNPALTAAIGRQLRLAGVNMASDTASADLIVRGLVTVGPPSGGEQPVRIVWRIDTADGSPVGEAAQENAVPAGSLDGRWGPIAGYASAAALDGILDILERRRTRDARPGIAVPGTPDLPPPIRPKTLPATGSTPETPDR